MNRFTAVLRLNHSGQLADLRSGIDRELSRGLFTYRLGQTEERPSGETLVEIATEIERARLAHILELAGEKLGFEVEHVGWGWLLTKDVPPEPSEVRAHFADPLLSAQTQQEGAKEYRFGMRPLLLYLVRMCWILLSVGIVLVAAIRGEDVLWLLAMIIFLFISFAPRGSFSRASSLYVDEAGIEIRRWLPRSRERVGWRELDGMDLRFRDRACTLLIGGQRESMTLAALQGDTMWLNVARTIAERASLNFTGGTPFDSLSYRKFGLG